MFAILADDCKFLPIFRVPANEVLDLAKSFFWISPTNGIVDAVSRVCKELFGEYPMSMSVLCNDEQSRSIFIKTMYDTRTVLFACKITNVINMMEQRIDECPFIRPECRVYEHPSRFIDNENIFVFKDNIKRNIFCLCLHSGGMRDADYNFIISFNFIGRSL